MVSNDNLDSDQTQPNGEDGMHSVPADHCPLTFILGPWLRVALHFTDRQLCWLEILVVDFEEAIIEHKLDDWLETVYAAWFARWPENLYLIYCAEEEQDDIAQRRQAILQIFTSKLEVRWATAVGRPPEVASIHEALEILDYLHDKAVQEYL